jgi:hypothetical protein
MLFQSPNGTRIDPMVVATVLVGIVTAVFLATAF